MELLYIWMEKHVGISDISLNFSNQYRFALNQKEKSLTVTPTESYTANFFSDNCTNVTGLIGANGTGKTSVLRYIIEHCTDGINSSAPKGSIIVFKNSKTFYYYSSIDIVLLGSLKK